MPALDDLYDLRNNFYAGNYTAVLNESKVLHLSDSELQREMNQFVFRAQLALSRYSDITLSGESIAEADAIQASVEYFKAKREGLSVAHLIDKVESLKNECMENDFVLVLCSAVLINEGLLESAFSILEPSTYPEARASLVFLYIRMNRLDLAETELSNLKQLCNDSTQSQIVEGFANIHLGEDKFQESYHIFQELCQINQSPMLLIGQALACIHMNRLSEAENILLDALHKDPQNVSVVANLYVCSSLLKKNEASKYREMFQKITPNHPFFLEIKHKEELFNSLLTNYQFQE